MKNGKFSLFLKNYISTFQSNTTCASITDYNVLISFFTARIPMPLMKWIMSLDTVPDKIDNWYTKMIHFQNQWDCTEQISQQSGRSTQTFQSFSSPRTTKDSNAMDVDMVKLPNKLTLEECKQCAKKGLCFHCHKSRHMASTCPTFSNPPKNLMSNTPAKKKNSPSLSKLKTTTKRME